ncbi:MAG: glutamate--tRNA ligase [Candidatus Chisholmbacteria bacterium]|nr:glutamate--tRNA ligase [Candidatus Chisholmbacteria bacterium]
MIRVRFAPSPTGVPHIGNTRTALYNWLFARHNGGKLILRIEDTDQARLVPGSQEKILEILKFLNLSWDEGPYRQSERLALYKKYAQGLVDKGSAYESEGAIRLRVAQDREMVWQDLIQGEIRIKTRGMNDPVLLKSDGFPTYHLAVVVDDHLMEISHILRAAEWISSTPKHLLIYEALGWKSPEMGHFSVILGPDKAKLSKRHGAKSVLDYRDEGYLPQALLTFMAYLGWTYEDNSKLLTLEELIEHFDLKQVHKANPIFDQEKLNYFNGLAIRQMNQMELIKNLRPFVPKDCPEDLVAKILPLVQERLVKLGDWEEMTEFFYRQVKPDKTVLVKEQLKVSQQLIEGLGDWRAEILEEKFRQEAGARNWQPGQFFAMLRMAVTGRKVTPPLFATMEVVGKREVIKRLENAQKYCP